LTHKQNRRYFRILRSQRLTAADRDRHDMTGKQARSQDCKFRGDSFSIWGQTYFEYYYTAIAC